MQNKQSINQRDFSLIEKKFLKKSSNQLEEREFEVVGKIQELINHNEF